MKKSLLLLAILILNKIIVPQVKVEINVITNQLKEDEKVFITGNTTNLGNWNPGSISLKKINDSTWNKIFEFPTNSVIEFKFTKGDWSTEALDSNKIVPPNTIMKIVKDSIVVFKIKNWGDSRADVSGKITGQVKYHRSFAGKNVLSRDIIVWLPPSYDSLLNKKYPVLYMQDGQNIFDPATSSFGVDWQIDDTADSLIKANLIEEIIIVGIFNSYHRRNEYSHSDTGYAYMKFIVEELKPFIDRTYRTLSDRENTAVCGSSLGGLITFMLLWEYSDIFSKAACFSPAFKIDSTYSLDFVTPVKNYSGPKKDFKIYIYNGGIGLDNELKPGIDEMLAVLCEKGYEMNKDIIWIKDNLAVHNETAWAKRVHSFLKIFFPVRE